VNAPPAEQEASGSPLEAYYYPYLVIVGSGERKGL